jgi:hypothetical protein
MRISNWVKLVGILCIVFGAYRIMSGVLELSLSQMIQTAPALLRPKFIIYLEIFVNMGYVVAGIFFLMKKSFSLNLMYFALTFKIIYGIISLLFIKFPDFPVLNIVLELVKPFFNAVLLIGVFKLSKYYFKSPEELAEFSGKKKRRDIYTPRLLKILSFTGIVFLSVPLLILILRIYSSIMGTTYAESVSIFNSFLPGFLQERSNSSYLSLAFCAIGVVLGIVCLKLRGKLWITLNIIVLVLCSLMLLLNLWSLL